MSVQFEIIEGPDAGETFAYPPNSSFVVGRDVIDNSGLQVPSDPFMSRHHFLVVVGIGGCMLRDCGSSNGLFVNGERVGVAEVSQGDNIRAGHTTLIVHLDTPPPVPSVHPSQEAILERFDLLEEIVSGGAARVFRAEDKTTGDAVALKFVRIDLTDASDRMPIFERELEATVALKHEHIAPVVATGISRDEAWLATRWIEGPTLQERVDNGPLFSERQGYELAVHLLDAVAYAHDRGFVHRDIKPANILLDREPWGYRPLLTDFGLAKRIGYSGSTLTSTGIVRGTPRFMPPEQVLASRSAGPAADQFSTAATIYHVLTGKWHYPEGGPSRSIFEALLEADPIPIRQQRRRLSKNMERALMRGLARRPESRYPSAAAFRDEMANLLESASETLS